jgi:hypothetical protein
MIFKSALTGGTHERAMTDFRRVTRDEFFAKMMRLDVNPQIVNSTYPYTSDWKLHRQPGQPVVGRCSGELRGGVVVKSYYLDDGRAL